jgi:hypothetical protein
MSLAYNEYKLNEVPPKLSISLKGPKHEIFVAEFFTQFKPVWVADLGIRK